MRKCNLSTSVPGACNVPSLVAFSPQYVWYINDNNTEVNVWCVQTQTSHPYWLCVTLLLGLLFWWGWPVTEMAVEGGKISLRKDGKGKVIGNKRLLIWVPCVVCLGNIKVIPFLVRSDQGSLPVCPLLSSVFVMLKYSVMEHFRKRLEAEWHFISLSFCLCLFLSLHVFMCACVKLTTA